MGRLVWRRNHHPGRQRRYTYHRSSDRSGCVIWTTQKSAGSGNAIGLGQTGSTQRGRRAGTLKIEIGLNLIGSSAEKLTSTFLWVVLPILVRPWKYACETDIFKPKKKAA